MNIKTTEKVNYKFDFNANEITVEPVIVAELSRKLYRDDVEFMDRKVQVVVRKKPKYMPMFIYKKLIKQVLILKEFKNFK